MQAIIMAAGKGSRLGDITKEKPKAFTEINNIKLIEYNIALLHYYGINDITIVTGYRHAQFEALLSSVPGIHMVYNPFYELMNVLGSFYMGQSELHEDVIYLHADTLCDPQIMDELINAEGDMVLPIDFKVCDEEAMKVLTEFGKIKQISKQIPCDIAEGEFIGIAKISKNILQSLKNASIKVLERGEYASYFEGAIQELIDTGMGRIIPLDTNGRFWGEIDFVEDLERVIHELPKKLVAIAASEWKR